MHSLLYALVSAGAANAAALMARDSTYSSNIHSTTYAQPIGAVGQKLTVNPGVSVWYGGGGTTNFYGNLDNSGYITVSQTDLLKSAPYAGGQTSDFVGHDTLNGNLVNRAGASISLNDYGSASAPTYDWYLNTMQNYGSLQFCGRGDTGGSTYQLYCDSTCYNYGVIDFEQYTNNLGASFVWRNSAISQSSSVNIYNEGAFRLVNVVYHNVQNVYGSGCFVIDTGAVLYLEDGSGAFQNPNYGPTFPSQSIYFASSSLTNGKSQTLHMDTQVYSHNSNFGPQVYGFGGSNAIEFYELISTFSYSSGVLNVAFYSGNQVNIKIGTGYDATQFYKANNPQAYNVAGYNAIFYRGSIPSQSAPGVCSVSLAKCANPATTATAPVSSTTTTTVASSTTVSTTTTTAVPTTTTTTTKPVTTTTTTTTTTAAPTTTTTTTKPSTTTTTTTTTVPTTTTTKPSTTTTTTVPTTTTVSTTTTVPITTTTKPSTTTTTTTTTPSTTTTTTLPTTTTTTLATSSTTTKASTTTSTSSVSTTSAASTTTSSASTTTAATTTTASGTGVCAGGAAPSSTYVASNGDVYGICKNTDFPGPNLSAVSGITTPQQCAETCSNTSGCIGGSLLYGASTCYLKGVQNPASANSGVDSIYKISSGTGSGSTTTTTTSAAGSSTTTTSVASSTTSSTTSAAPTTTLATTTSIQSTSSTTTSSGATGTGRCANGAGPDRTYTASNGDVYGVCLNTDFAGQNLGNPVSSITTPEQCADVCSQTSGCIAGSLLRGASLCYLKDINNAASANSGVDSVYKISSGSGSTTSASSTTTTKTASSTLSSTTATTSTTSLTLTTTSATSTTVSSTSTTSTATATGRCANGAGPDSTYTASNGDIYGVCLNTDFPGQNLGNPVGSITSTGQCAETCSSTSGCIAGSWVRGSNLCYLKDINNPASSNSGVDSVYKISSGTGSGSTTTTGTTSATTTAAPTSTTSGSGPVTVTVTTTVTSVPMSSGCSWVCPTAKI